MSINDSTFVAWLMMSIRMTAPILFAALGGLMTTRVGIFNLGLEGMMLFGAFFGYYGSLVSGSPWIGLLVAILVGALLGVLFAFFSVTLNVNQVLTSVGLNTLALGVTSYLSRVLLVNAKIIIAPTFKSINIPVLSDLPVIGPLLFGQNILIYLSIILVIFIHWFLFKTTTGLNLRSIGEDATVSRTVGINVSRYRYLATIASGVLASLGGAYITTVAVNRFLENIVEGRGWIAMAAVIFGSSMPWGILVACLLFGSATGLQMIMQVRGVQLPYKFALMVPYVVTMVALAVGAISQKKRKRRVKL